MRERNSRLQEIVAVGRLLGGAIVFALILLYMWASAFFSRSVSFQWIWHQIASRWLLLSIVVIFFAFFLFAVVRLVYLITNMTAELLMEYKWRHLSREKEALEENLKRFYSALKRIHMPLAITKDQKILWYNNEMSQLVQTKINDISDVEKLFPAVDLPQKMVSIARRLKVQNSYSKRVFVSLADALRPMVLSAVCLKPRAPEQGVLWCVEDASVQYQNIALERYYETVFTSLKLFHNLKDTEDEMTQLSKMLKNVSSAYQLSLAGILTLNNNCLITRAIYSDGKFSSVPSQFDLHDPVVKTSAVAKAVKLKKCVGYSDVAPLPYYRFLKDTTKDIPQSTCAFPIIINRHLEGVITLYGSERNFFSPKLLQYLNQLFTEIFQSIGVARLRRKNKEELAEYAKQLRVQVTELTKGRRILKRQAREMNGIVKDMIEARDQAEEASQVKSDFLASVSHELRTPLNAILGFSEAMETETFGPMHNQKYKEYTRYIYTSGKYLLSLINDVLDLSAVESKHKRRDERWLNLSELVKETVEIIQGYPDGDKKLFSEQIGDDLFLFAEDRSIRQIFLNVLSNAVKFTGENGKIDIRASLNSRHDLRVVISDNGIGIPKDKIKTLFQPFVQIENVMTKEHKGSGLGLVLIKKIMESYQGTVQLTSKYGTGTKVILIFPKERIKKMRKDEHEV